LLKTIELIEEWSTETSTSEGQGATFAPQKRIGIDIETASAHHIFKGSRRRSKKMLPPGRI
jgi:hypothetical protein